MSGMLTECGRVHFTGARPDFKTELGLSFSDYVEAFNPKAGEQSNSVTFPRMEPCIALYPSVNKNGSWVMYNMTTKAYVRRMQWRKLPMTQVVINVMNDDAGKAVITSADVSCDAAIQETASDELAQPVQVPVTPSKEVAFMAEEGMIEDDVASDEDDDQLVPELGHYEDDSDCESGEATVEMEQELQELEELLEDSSDLQTASEQQQVPLRRSARTNQGVQRYDDVYQWNLLNLSVGTAIHSFRAVASDACKTELLQLFKEKNALTPVHWDKLAEQQKDRAVRSHMFLKEKFEDSKFVKMKAHLVADGRMQDRTVYTDFSSPTAKTRSAMTCLKLAAIKGWDLLKVDIGGAFLCADITRRRRLICS
jgi:hypothetical protein